MECRPDEKAVASWQARLASLIGRGLAEADPRVVQCRQALAFWRCHKVIAAEASRLGADGRDLLVALLDGTQP